MLMQESTDNPWETFLFSVMLTILGFASHTTTADLTLDAILDMFVLFRGPKHLAKHTWQLLEDSPYLALIICEGKQTAGLQGEVHDHLAELQAANQDSPYREELAELQKGIYQSAQAFNVRSIGQWPSLISDDFFALLRQHDSRALVVLSQYAIILHAFHETWWIGHWGTKLLSAIDKVFLQEEQMRLNWSMVEMERLMEVHYPVTKQTL